eukprot:1134372-Prymnesium_polylepis.2
MPQALFEEIIRTRSHPENAQTTSGHSATYDRYPISHATALAERDGRKAAPAPRESDAARGILLRLGTGAKRVGFRGEELRGGAVKQRQCGEANEGGDEQRAHGVGAVPAEVARGGGRGDRAD